jgi:hypothetical protein
VRLPRKRPSPKVGNELIPIFVYVDEYPEVDGHQNIAEYLTRKGNNQLTSSDINFEKLCKVADLNPQQLRDLGPEKRNAARSLT